MIGALLSMLLYGLWKRPLFPLVEISQSSFFQYKFEVRPIWCFDPGPAISLTFLKFVSLFVKMEKPLY